MRRTLALLTLLAIVGGLSAALVVFGVAQLSMGSTVFCASRPEPLPTGEPDLSPEYEKLLLQLELVEHRVDAMAEQ
jgi:hypothetical protein